jgi:competence protein ComEC
MKISKWQILLVFLFLNALVWYAVISETPNGVLAVSFLDVGQGDAIFIESPNGNQILIDGGPPNGTVLRELGKHMPFYDRYIDVVLATHPDADHTGGLIDVLSRYDVGIVIDTGLPHDTNIYNQKERIISEKNIKRISGRRGKRVILEEGIYMDILFPDRDVEGFSPNDASIITQLVYGDHEFLFTGDAPKKMEDYIVGLDGENIESDVLKAGHHGSKTSNGDALLGYAKPQYVVISAGQDNRYGHPHEEVLTRFTEYGVTVFRTDELGTVTFETDGRSLSIK